MSVSYTLRIDDDVFKRIESEARRRHKANLSDMFLDVIACGLSALPPIESETLVADTWEKLGPAPEIDYDRLPKR